MPFKRAMSSLFSAAHLQEHPSKCRSVCAGICSIDWCHAGVVAISAKRVVDGYAVVKIDSMKCFKLNNFRFAMTCFRFR